jgi:4a-hydroxytetrahydrobiopterin dehydratase
MEATSLSSRHCVPCEGIGKPLEPAEALRLVEQVPAWELAGDFSRLRRVWRVANFMQAIEFINRVAELAEAEQHHPDILLTGYRQLALELTTHALGGLTENDFILAARIDALPQPQLHQSRSGRS